MAHDLGFTAALEYERGRPSYARAAVERIRSEVVSGAERLLDLGAGTGQLSRLFAPHVDLVVAVEPSGQMRDLLARNLPGACVLAGEAERLPLPDSSVDAVVVGEAFHWFRGDLAVAEIARVLRPGRGLGLLWNVAIRSDPPWPDALTELIARQRDARVPEQRRYSSGAWRRAFDETDLFEPLRQGSAEHRHRQEADAFVAQIASWSYIASLPERERDTVLRRVRSLAPEAITVTLRTDFYWTRRRVPPRRPPRTSAPPPTAGPVG